ncbi:hypothetical protein PG999_000370 [Apiospora kogelbergensis]|uniref:Protein kinase domain-containing protein n=1 Tax=Apiospora kogelbergensis TaxID=1337665 RepID=A0AAW0RB93_9PEZI
MATPNKIRVLAAKRVSELDGYIVRASINGLIRYISVTDEALQRFPERWNKPNNGDAFLVLPRIIPADLKCLHLRRPSPGDMMSPRDVTSYPIHVPVIHELSGVKFPMGLAAIDYSNLVQFEKISSARFENRLCEDRLRVRRPRQAPGLLMKLVEFPDTWPGWFQADPAIRATGQPASIALVSPESKEESKVCCSQVGYGQQGNITPEQYMAHEIEIHQQIDTALGGMGTVVPRFSGLVTEQGRGVVGFLSEFFEGAQSYFDIFRAASAASIRDYVVPEAERQACRAALGALHAAGFVHGDVHAGNFIRLRDGSVRIVDLEDAQRINVLSVKGVTAALMEMELLEKWLVEKSCKYAPAMSFS